MSELNFESVKDAKDRPVLYERAEPVPAPLYERETVQRAEELAAALERGDQPNTELSLDEAVEQTKRNRAVNGDPFAEQRLPIIERRYSDDGPTPEYRPDFIGDDPEERRRDGLSLRKLNEDLAQTRRTEKQIERANAGYTPEEIEVLEEVDRSLQKQPQRIGAYNAFTGLRPALRDNEPVPPEAAITIEDMRKEVANYRLADQVYREQMQQQWEQLREQTQLNEAADQLAQQTEPAPAVSQPPQPQQAQQATRPAIDPERQQLAAAAQTWERAAQWTEAERNAYTQARAHVDAFTRAYPEVTNAAVAAEVQRQNPQRFAQMQNDWQRTLAAAAPYANAYQTAQTQRLAHQRQLAEIEHAQRRITWDGFRRAEDAKFHQYAPELNEPQTAVALRAGVRQMFKDTGFSEDEIRAAWNGETGFSLRDHRAQRLAYDAFKWRQAQAAALNLNAHKRVAPVVAPGMSQPRGAASESEIRAIERDLETARGDRAIKLATRLTQLRRGAA